MWLLQNFESESVSILALESSSGAYRLSKLETNALGFSEPMFKRTIECLQNI